MLKKCFSVAAVLCVSVVGCKSTSYEVQEVETKLTKKGSTPDGDLGLNDKGEAVVQSTTSAGAEFTVQQHINEKLEAELRTQQHSLKLCRRDLADPRLGGSGEISALPRVDNLKEPIRSTEEFGKDEQGRLVVVKKSYFEERLATEKAFETSLRQVLATVKESREDCEHKMGMARVKHGLPSARYAGKGFFSKGEWIETRKAEHTLDDAFEILNSEQQGL